MNTLLVGGAVVLAILGYLTWLGRPRDPEAHREGAPERTGPPAVEATPPTSAPTPPPTPPTPRAIATFALALTTAANADVIDTADNAVDTILDAPALADLDPSAESEVIWRACITLLRRERDDRALQTGVPSTDLADRMLASAQFDLELSEPTVDN